MACNESGGRRFLLSFGLFVAVSCSFCNCASLTRLEALHKFQGQPEGSLLHHGRLLVGQSSLQGSKPKITEAAAVDLDVDSDYQADMVWEPPAEWAAGPRPSPDSRAVEQLLKLEPEVECTGDSMHLNVRNPGSTPGSLFLVDRGGHLPPLPLSKLPPSCGFTFKSTQGHLVFVAPYDGCFVAREGDSYVLPLRWFGLAVRMSCPLTRPSAKPPMVTCHSEGMIVKTGWTVPVAKIGVKLKGSWEPLMKASSTCGFSVVVHPEGLVISAHYAPCLEEKDGMYTLELTGDGESTISCPSLSASHPEPAEGARPHPDRHHPHSKPPGSPPFPVSPGKPHDAVAAATPDPQVPHYPVPFYVPPQPGPLSAQPPVTEPQVTHPAGQPEHHEPNPSSPFVFYNLPLVDPAFFNEPHAEHFFYQDPFYHGFPASDHHPMPMPLKQEAVASSPQSPASPHPEAPHAPSGLVQQLEQVPAPSSNGKKPQPLTQHPSNGGAVPPDSPWFSPVHCPKVCPSGFSNCCPQLAFNQYLHLAPVGFGRKRTGFGGSWDSAHHNNHNPAEPLQVHSASLQSGASGNRHEYLQPPDGVHAPQARRHPSELHLPDSFYNLPYVDPFHPAPYSVPSRPWAPDYPSFNQMVQFEPYNVHGPKLRHHFMNSLGLNQKPAAWQLQPSHSQARELPELDPLHVPDPNLQEGQAPLVPASSHSQLSVNAMTDYTAHDQTGHPDSEPQSNVLLHHGPAGWRMGGWSDSHSNPGPSFPREHYHRAAWDR
ncbi:uncharacterized protein LOC114844593 [Betta splendens]|uniref:Uncharacterized protein LOC114844593 n=1 Tax=Betta splendens TaxID=158456 RepID=A0A6P7KZQ4_BETSP|nr:uncharacterized protein LOC114844593 [Betta splendens]